MSKEAQQEPSVQRANFPATMTMETLMAMFLENQKQLAEAQSKLAEAILEARKPYVDPKVLEAKRLAGEERRKEIELQMRIKVATKKRCPHIRENGTPNIKWMEHSNGITKGVCGQCFSEFDTRNPADLDILRRDLKSIKNMGRAGSHARRGTILD
jgi:hypothetical protein